MSVVPKFLFDVLTNCLGEYYYYQCSLYRFHCYTLVIPAKAREMNVVVGQVYLALWEDEQADGKKIPRWQPARVVKSTGRGPSQRRDVVWLEKKMAFLWKPQLPTIRIKLSILVVYQLHNWTISWMTALRLHLHLQRLLRLQAAVPAVSPEVNLNNFLSQCMYVKSLNFEH